MKKHYDDKNEILERIRGTEKAQATAFAAQLILGLLTLHDDLGCRDQRLNKYIDGMLKRNNDFNDGKFNLNDITKELLDKTGIVVELPSR